jgi:hypothetical protein
MRDRVPDRLLTFGKARIGHDRPHPYGGIHDMDTTDKVEKTGVYTLVDGTPVRLKEGDVMPAGAKFRDAGEDLAQSPRQMERERIAEATDAESKAAAKEARAKGPAPENR